MAFAFFRSILLSIDGRGARGEGAKLINTPSYSSPPSGEESGVGMLFLYR